MWGMERHAPEQDPLGLWICPECGSSFVQHLEAEPIEGRRWRLLLRCPDCEWHAEDVHDHEDVLRYDRELEAGEVLLARSLHLLESENMAEWAESFRIALRADLVVPADF